MKLDLKIQYWVCGALAFWLVANGAYAQKEFDKEGHRGCRGLMPENTIPAMKQALLLGVNTLEMDVHFSQDKKALISHDPYVSSKIALKPDGSEIKPEEEKNYILYKMNYDEIRRFDVGSKFYPEFPQQKKIKTYKPLLAELIDSVETFVTEHHLPLPQYNIETKSTPEGDDVLHPAPEEFVKLMMQVIFSKHIENRVIIQSFDPRTLEIIHRDYPAIRTSWLTANPNSCEDNLKTLTFTPTIYSPYFMTVNEETVKLCHSKNILVVPWTVNSTEEITRLKSLGVDGIISDYPNLLH
jgi:glycerophosphoryl diester phosphodiesterase